MEGGERRREGVLIWRRGSEIRRVSERERGSGAARKVSGKEWKTERRIESALISV